MSIFKNPKIIAVTLARSGSKRIKNKNIKNFNGKPLIYYTIKEALKVKEIQKYIISTDSEEIKKIAIKYGANVPFLRPKQLALDTTPDQPVLKYILEKLQKKYDFKPDIILNLRTTTPLRTAKIIRKALKIFISNKFELLRTVSKAEGTNHPFWMYTLNNQGVAKNFIKKLNVEKYSRSQLLPKVYRINGVVDIYSYNLIMNKKILNEKMITMETPSDLSIDIDNHYEFKYCEYLYNLKKI